MRINKKSHMAFSLTELIIVLVIIALLFSAMAPIITKRHIADNGAIENIWNFVNNDTERNAYFDPGAPDWTSSIYVGMDPIPNYSDSGKLVINSTKIDYNGVEYPQPQLQFRFSPSESELSNGIDSGSLLLDESGNIYFGQIRPMVQSGTANTILGFSALNDAQSAQGYVAVGTGALESANVPLEAGKRYYVTAVGSNAGSKLNKAYNGNGIFVGAGAGFGHSASNIGIGYHAFFSEDGVAAENNIAIGVNSGILRGTSANNNEYKSNIFVNTNASSAINMNYNTIIGYGSYASGEHTNMLNADPQSYQRYLTSVGFSACSSIGANKGLNTCIGYGSGSEVRGTPDYNDSNSAHLDEHIFLGGVPAGNTGTRFNGRGVMEVHTYGSGSGTTILDSPGVVSAEASGADVVFNSNLVIRGKLYASDGANVVNYKFIDSRDMGLEPKYYRCTSDIARDVLVSYYDIYMCNDEFNVNASGEGDSLALPKTINVLQRDSSNPPPANVINSDVRLKTNIVENNVGLNKLLQLKPFNYTFKSAKNKLPQVGVIAQDLAKIFPESVFKDDKGFLKIRWDEMFYAMINSIKELSQKLDELTQKIAGIGKDLDMIKSQHKNLRKQLTSLDARLKRLERK